MTAQDTLVTHEGEYKILTIQNGRYIYIQEIDTNDQKVIVTERIDTLLRISRQEVFGYNRHDYSSSDVFYDHPECKIYHYYIPHKDKRKDEFTCNQLKDGAEVEYDKSGRIICWTSYREGKLHGVSKCFHRNGKLKEAKIYYRGAILEYSMYNKHGDTVLYVAFDLTYKEKVVQEIWYYTHNKRKSIYDGYEDIFYQYFDKRGKALLKIKKDKTKIIAPDISAKQSDLVKKIIKDNNYQIYRLPSKLRR